MPGLKNNILQNIQKLAEPFNGPVAGAILGKQIETLQNQQSPLSSRLPILQTLKESNVLPATASLIESNPDYWSAGNCKFSWRIVIKT